MDDNLPIHRTKIVMDYMSDNHINTTKWPTQSPVTNITEVFGYI